MDIILKRACEITFKDDRRDSLTLSIDKPTPHPEGDFQCTYHLHSCDRDHSQTLYHVDAIEALFAVFHVLQAELEGLEKRESCVITWRGNRDWGLRSSYGEYTTQD
jgi:Domain of unknown function (DUF6968)